MSSNSTSSSSRHSGLFSDTSTVSSITTQASYLDMDDASTRIYHEVASHMLDTRRPKSVSFSPIAHTIVIDCKTSGLNGTAANGKPGSDSSVRGSCHRPLPLSSSSSSNVGFHPILMPNKSSAALTDASTSTIASDPRYLCHESTWRSRSSIYLDPASTVSASTTTTALYAGHTPHPVVPLPLASESNESLEWNEGGLETMSPKKRRYSVISSSPPDNEHLMRHPMSAHVSIPTDQFSESYDAHHRRKFQYEFASTSSSHHDTTPSHSAHTSKEPSRRSFAPTNGHRHSYSQGAAHAPQLQLQGDPPIIFYSHSTQPSHEFCAEVNKCTRSLFNDPLFDFREHVEHRKYVIRTLRFSSLSIPTSKSTSTTSDNSQCVLMLDTGVDALLPSFFPPLPSPPSPASDTFVVGPTQDKGMGIFARHPIPPLRVILTERPILVTPYVIGMGVPFDQLYADIKRTLGIDVLAQLIGATKHYAENVVGEDGKVNYEKLIRMTALAITLAVPVEKHSELPTHRGVFLQTSRCNHSCGPNAKWDWDPTTCTLTLTAVRPIQQNEEITIAYVPPHLPFSSRAALLRELYNFDCLCPYCTMSSEDKEKSDAARSMLVKFWDVDGNAVGLPNSKEWCSNYELADDVLIKAHRAALEMIYREGLHGLVSSSLLTDWERGSQLHFGAVQSRGSAKPANYDLSRHCDSIAICYGVLSDASNFTKWLGRAMDARAGESEGDIKERRERAYVRWLEDPEAFPAWGDRRKMKSSGDDA